MTLITEMSLLRLRQKASRLYLPILVLAATCFALAFFADGWVSQNRDLAYISAAVVAGLGWLFPTLSYLFSFVELTSSRIIFRFGFLGLRKREAQLTEISAIEIIRPRALGGRVISLTLVNESELWLSGYARTKLLASEIERLARATL